MDKDSHSRMIEACARTRVDPASVVDCWLYYYVPVDREFYEHPNYGLALREGFDLRVPAATRFPYPRIGVISNTVGVKGVYWSCFFIETVDEYHFTASMTTRTHPEPLTLTYRVEDGRYFECLYLLDPPFDEPSEEALRMIDAIQGQVILLVNKLKQGALSAYIPKGCKINKQRIAVGKKPFISWTTVELPTPPSPHSEPKGGHHASPRLHDRRGHYRTYKTGKRVWVKNCKVGSAADGIGFHDYKVS